MTSDKIALFFYEINHNPPRDEAGTITVNAKIFGEIDNGTFKASSLIEEFIDEDEVDECQIKQNLNYFLTDAGLDNDFVNDVLMNLAFYVDEIFFHTPRYFLDRTLEIWMNILPNEFSEIEETTQTLFDQDNNIKFKPASKIVVDSLTKKTYNKQISSLVDDKCMICLEEFSNETKVVTLPCEHDFDEECIVKWFETSHVCPLCRFEFPCENQ